MTPAGCLTAPACTVTAAAAALRRGRGYVLRVRAHGADGAGPGPWSAPASVLLPPEEAAAASEASSAEEEEEADGEKPQAAHARPARRSGFWTEWFFGWPHRLCAAAIAILLFFVKIDDDLRWTVLALLALSVFYIWVVSVRRGPEPWRKRPAEKKEKKEKQPRPRFVKFKPR